MLILSTHTTESYTKTHENYEESAGWRTLDENYNMLSIGDRVERLLTAAGIRVLRDRELHACSKGATKPASWPAPSPPRWTP